MRLVPAPANTPTPRSYVTAPRVARRPAPERRGRWIAPLVLAGAIAGTMWMVAEPITSAGALKILAGAAAGLAIAMLIDGPPPRQGSRSDTGGARPRPQPSVAPAAAAPVRVPARAAGGRTGVPSAMDLGSLPPALRNAVSAPPSTPDPRSRS